MVSAQGTFAPGGSGPVRFTLYSAVQVLANGVMVLMMLHLRRRALYRQDTPRRVVLTAYWHSATMATGFLLSIPVFFVWDRAWIVWIVTPVVLGAAGRRYFTLRSRQGRTDTRLYDDVI